MKRHREVLFLACLSSLGLMACEDIPSGTTIPYPVEGACSTTVPCGSGVCDLETGTCVGCLSDSDCVNSETPICNLDKHECTAECKEDSDCPKGVCDTAHGMCVECNVDADCAEGVCDTTNHVCVACNVDADCAEGVCDTTNHVCVECTVDSDCEEGVCDTTNHVCVECVKNADCAEGVCDTTNHVCVECVSNEDCPSSVCDETAHQCRGCTAHSECTNEAEPICNFETKKCEPCQWDPATANKCPEANAELPICASTGDKAGQCVECETGDDCESGVCIGNVCKQCDDTHACPGETEFCETAGDNANMCVVCSDTVACPNDLVCSPEGLCVACNVDADCKDEANPACDTANHVCVECNSATQSENCGEDKPVCDDGTHSCVVCIRGEEELFNETCQTLDSTKPICLEDKENSQNNKCVACDSATSSKQCTDSETSPICILESEDGDVNICAPCTTNEQCAAKEGAYDLCNTTSGACVECLTVTDCGEGMKFCEENKCGNCHEGNDCPSGVCVDNLCRECTQDSDCVDPSKPVCATSGVHKNQCVPCQTETEAKDCAGKVKNGNSTPVCAVDDDESVVNQCVECNPGETPNAPAEDCKDRKTETDIALPYCAMKPASQAHTCVECIPTPAESDTGIDASCLNVIKDGVLSQVCADERAAESVQNTCVECDDDAVKTQCTTIASPICNIDSESANAYHCEPCNSTDSTIGNAQCAKKDSSKPVCVQEGSAHGVVGSCVECVVNSDCASGVCNDKNQCVECTDRDSNAQCTDPSKGVCCDEASLNAGTCTAKTSAGVYQCEKCDITTNCIGGVCDAKSGRCVPCESDDECVSVERGICVAGVCEKCEEQGADKNCNLVCNANNGKCEPCVDVSDNKDEINCIKVCDGIRETCEPCDNETYYCHTGVCNETEGYCEPCSTENCDGTCGADGLCHKVCTTGTLCSKDGYDFNRESCCTGTEICTTSGTCIVPGDECVRDTQCTTWDKCDIPDGATVGNCVPIESDPEACFTIPEFEKITPKIKWHYEDSVISTPVVADLTGDGIPEVIYTNTGKKLIALNGEDGTATAISTTAVFNSHDDMATADVDNDGKLEVLIPSSTNSANTTGLYVMNLVPNGSGYAWQQKALIKMPLSEFTSNNSAYWADLHPTVADIDSDGIPEIVTTRGIIKGNDLTQRTCSYKMGQFYAWYHYMFAVADLDQDGNSEIIVDKIYDNNCNVILNDSAASGWGYAAVADLLPDAGEPGELVPEIVRVLPTSASSGKVSLWKVYKNGTTWSEKKIWEKAHPGGGGGNPVIADFDGDGIPEIGVAGGNKLAVFKASNGTVLWSSNTDDDSSFKTGAAVFDFEADGKAEVVYRDQQKIRIYNGSDGNVLWEDYSTSGTVIDYPLIVDVDADNQTEILVVSEAKGSYHHDRLGVTVYADTYGKWVPARKIWNQHSYHVTNINDDGTVPVHEEANWLNKRLNNYRANIPPEGFYNQPNFVPGLLIEDKTNCKGTPSKLGLQATIANLGDRSIEGEIQISYYLESPDGTTKYYIGTSNITGLEINASSKLSFEWDQKTVYEIIDDKISDSPTTLSSIKGYKAVFVVDDAGNTGKDVYEECNEDDNSLKTSQYLILTGC